jgi:hypothetical protein
MQNGGQSKERGGVCSGYMAKSDEQGVDSETLKGGQTRKEELKGQTGKGRYSGERFSEMMNADNVGPRRVSDAGLQARATTAPAWC